MNQQGIEDGFIIVLFKKGGEKGDKTEKKGLCGLQLENFSSEPLEIFPVRLNTAKARVENVLICDFRCEAA